MQKEKVNIFEKHARKTGWLLMIILLILADLLAGKILIPENYNKFRIRNATYHHGIVPQTECIANWGQQYYHFFSNSLGFRDSAAREVQLTSDKYRILFMGDSHTEAVGIDYRDSFVGRLAEELKDSDVEVLNGSAVSYSPKIHYLKTKFLVEEMKLDIDELFVVIDMSDLNNEIAYESFEGVREGDFKSSLRIMIKKLTYRSAVIHLVDRFIKRQRNKFFIQNMAISESADFELYSSFFSDFRDADLLNNPNFHHVSQWLEDEEFRDLAKYSLRLGQENITKLHQICNDHNIKLTISVHPWQDQILKGDTTNLYVDSWRNFAEGNGIGFINLFPVFINQRNPVVMASQCYIPHDNHWSELGHELVFNRLIKYIRYEPGN